MSRNNYSTSQGDNMPTIYEQLHETCLELIKDYQTDLTKHDKEWLTNNPTTKFIHFTRVSGTHMVELHDASWYPAKGEQVKILFGHGDREQVLKNVPAHYRGIIHNFGNQMRAIHYFDGKELREISQDYAKQVIENYVYNIKQIWQATDSPVTFQ